MEAAKPNEGARGVAVLALLAVLGVAVALRAAAAPAGLPMFTRSPEEHLHLGRAVRIARGDLDPHFYVYPTLHFYAMAATLRLGFGSEIDTDPLTVARDNPNLLAPAWSDRFALASRWLSIAFGVGAVLAMYLAGRALEGELTGLIAAAFTAVNPVHLYATTDTAVDSSLSLFLCLTLWRLIRICQAPTVANCAWAGLCAGLALSCKQPALVLFGLIVLAQVLATSALGFEPRRWQNVLVWLVVALLIISGGVALGLAGNESARVELVDRIFRTAGVSESMAQERAARAREVLAGLLAKAGAVALIGGLALAGSRRLRMFGIRALLTPGPLAALAVGFLAFAVTSPYLLIRFGGTLRATLHLAYQGTTLGWGGGLVAGARDYALQLFWQFGPIWWAAAAGAVLVMLGLSGGFRYRWGAVANVPGQRLALLIVTATAVLYFLAFAGHRTPYMWYMMPASLALTLLAAVGLTTWRGNVADRPRALFAWWLVAVPALAWPLVASIDWLHEVSATPTQMLALRWLDENAPAGSVIVRTADSTTPEILGGKYHVVDLNYGMEKMSWDYLAGVDADYIVLSERMHGPWKLAPSRFARELAGFEWAYANLPRVASFRPGGLEANDRTDINRRVGGPEVGIYKVPDARKRPGRTPTTGTP